MEIVMSFCALSLLLVIGKLLRSSIPILQKLYLPSSVIGGLLGLLMLTLGKDWIDPAWTAGWGQIPGFLINVVFAGLFLGAATPGLKRVWRIGSQQLCFGQLLAWGQYVIGLGLVGVLLIPWFNVPPAFGNLLEIGFEGGHGTVAGLSDIFEQRGWSVGRDLGFTTATVGMVLGISIGMILVNWAGRKGHIRHIRPLSELSRWERRGIYRARQQPPAGKQTVYCDSIDSLAWHAALIGIAILLGFGLKCALAVLEPYVPEWLARLHVLASFPLFPLCMVGGLMLQTFLEGIRLNTLVDQGQMQRLSGAALDFLVVSAVASIRLSVVTDYWQPLLLLLAAGTCWSIFMVMYVGPRLFREAWFERSIAEFGQSMGVTATGLLLLRTVDPESRTSASEAFGYKQLLHEPVMGGGIWTSVALPWVLGSGWLVVWCFCSVVFAIWLFVAWRIARNHRSGRAV